ncbi:MAG: PEGA domain-containing protein [Sandaracinus sp.]|nr:PEGA domain-containing protein [Sandaracinus sp.]MCB9619003.1 PEGA domain-containing protein [Sandaracinus sp.]
MLRVALTLVLGVGVHAGLTLAQEATSEAPRSPVAPASAPQDQIGLLTMLSEAPARLYVDGYEVGRTPLRYVRLWPGEHEVELRFDSGRSLRSRMHITAGHTVTRRVAAP